MAKAELEAISFSISKFNSLRTRKNKTEDFVETVNKKAYLQKLNINNDFCVPVYNKTVKTHICAKRKN